MLRGTISLDSSGLADALQCAGEALEVVATESAIAGGSRESPLPRHVMEGGAARETEPAYLGR